MGFASQFKALFKKNIILWYRNLCGSLCELLFPIILLVIIVLVRNIIKNTDVSAQGYVNRAGFAYYYDDSVTVNTNPNYTSPVKLGLSAGNAFSACIQYNRLIFAFVGSNELYSTLQNDLFSSSGVLASAIAGGVAFAMKNFNSETDLEDYVTDKDYDSTSHPGVCVGIVISGTYPSYAIKLRYDDNNYLDTSDSDYKMQIPTPRLPAYNDLTQLPDETSFHQYRTSGFTFLQYLISQEVLRKHDSSAKIRMGVVPVRTGDYVKDAFLSAAGDFLGIIVVLCYMVPVFRIISIVVQDKELKTREGMKMMGLKDSAYWLSLLAYYMIIFIVLAVILAAISTGFLFKHSSWLLMFFFYLLFGLSVFSFSMFLSSFFYRARIASITGIMLYFASYLVISLVQDQTIDYTSKTLSSLLPTVSAALGYISYVSYENGQLGVGFDNATAFNINYKVSTSLLMLVADIFIYAVLGLYLDNVVPSPMGVHQSPLFFLTKQYWCDSYNDSPESTAELQEGDEKLAQKAEDEILYPNGHFEKVGEEQREQETRNECLKIRHLNKFFGRKQSVNDFSVNMYKSQIFSLLGPNGAGKTTTISMLSGLLSVSSGTAHFAGLSLFRQMDLAREKLGVCPQHDVLFESLTPREHLAIFAAFKGRNDTEAINKDVDEILNDIDLRESENVIASNLSGGQRRKLSIGIAFIGNADMIYLDEPTSGIDIAARKKVWAMLKKYKTNKVIILTTHYMEEAEELGDRIGIMTSGTMRCVGSPLFLKSVYGAGYNLIVVRNDVPKDQEVETQTNITKFLTEHMEHIKLKKEAGKEVTYFIPKDKAKQFKPFFLELDSHLERLQIKSYGVTMNTLEEIFLRVARSDEKAHGEIQGQKLTAKMHSESIGMSSAVYKPTELDMYSIANEPEKPFCTNVWIHFMAILTKRVLINLRGWTSMVNELLVPIVLVIFGFALTKVPTYFDSDPRWLGTDLFDTPQRTLVNTNCISGSYGISDVTQYLDGNFQPMTYTVTGSTDNEILNNIDQLIYDSRNVNPCRYGSIYARTLDPTNKLYEFVVYVNMSSQDSSGAFVSYFLNPILRLATGNNNMNLQFANAPLPLTYKTRSMEDADKGDLISDTLVVSFALLPAAIVSFIVREREINLKHQQLISGVSLLSYWMANSIPDVIKSLVPCTVGVGMVFAFGISFSGIWILFIIFAFTIVPFTYFTSFAFEQENAAQTSTLMLHFFCGVVLSPVFTILRLFESTRSVGKGLAWVLRVIPSFSLGYGISNIA